MTGERGELIAMLFELVRLDADFPADWAVDRLPQRQVPAAARLSFA